jgi:hypothetical protein
VIVTPDQRCAAIPSLLTVQEFIHPRLIRRIEGARHHVMYEPQTGITERIEL